MINYIQADIKRSLNKKAFLLSFLSYISIFLLIIFILSNPNFTQEDYLTRLSGFLGFYPLFIGLSIYLAIYYDDFKSNSMQIAIGRGMSRERLVLTKFIETIIMSLISLIVLALIFFILPPLISIKLEASQVAEIIRGLLGQGLIFTGYIAISLPFIYYNQKAVSGLIIYLLLASKFILLSLTLILSQDIVISLIGNRMDYLLTNLVAINLSNKANFLSLSINILYYLLGVFMSIGIFKKKELEF